ncbi:MAG: hypothetical protein WC449_01415 [Candidatus Paceibacterota bacterium]
MKGKWYLVFYHFGYFKKQTTFQHLELKAQNKNDALIEAKRIYEDEKSISPLAKDFHKPEVHYIIPLE